VNIEPYSTESLQQLLESEHIQFTTPHDAVTQLVDYCARGSTISIVLDTNHYILSNVSTTNTNVAAPTNSFINTILERYKVETSSQILPCIEVKPALSVETTISNFFDTQLDYLYFSNVNALISFSDNKDAALKFAHKKISQLESQYAIEKLNQAKKEQLIRALKYDLREFKVAMYIPGMSWIGKLFKIIGPGLGKLYQYHPVDLKFIDYPQKKLTHVPKISIVTPSFEQGIYLEKTIQSVLSQNYSNLEYVVKDGGSKDSSKRVLERYQDKLSYWTSEPDSGQSQAINLGFAHTTGEIMAWLNSDDLLLPGALAYVADYFNTHPEIDVIYGNRRLIDENDMDIGRWILPGHSSKVLLWTDFIPQETMFWRRSIWEKVGGRIDESFRFAMDWDLLIRFQEAGAKFAHLPRFLGAFRVHGNQKTTAANDIGSIEKKRIQKRIFGQVPSKHKILLAVIPFILRHMAVNFIYLITSSLKRKHYKDVFPQANFIEENKST
jgi:glycosyltransferase involved in cell wall biosynthesis